MEWGASNWMSVRSGVMLEKLVAGFVLGDWNESQCAQWGVDRAGRCISDLDWWNTVDNFRIRAKGIWKARRFTEKIFDVKKHRRRALLLRLTQLQGILMESNLRAAHWGFPCNKNNLLWYSKRFSYRSLFNKNNNKKFLN